MMNKKLFIKIVYFIIIVYINKFIYMKKIDEN